MNKKLYALFIIFLFLLTACQEKSAVMQVETVKIPEAIIDINTSEKIQTEITAKLFPDETSMITESITEIEKESEAEIKTETERVPSSGELVRILDYIPDAVIDLRYATTNNFTNTVIYDDDEAYLCYGTIKKLCKVQEALKEKGFRIIIWDAYRPEEAQYKLWEVCPDPTYVANPKKRITSHSRGNTVDIGIVYEDGSEVELPSAFDEFSSLADRDYSDVSSKAAQNSYMLEEIMNQYGFKGYWGEWWDYSDIETYDLIIPEN